MTSIYEKKFPHTFTRSRTIRNIFFTKSWEKLSILFIERNFVCKSNYSMPENMNRFLIDVIKIFLYFYLRMSTRVFVGGLTYRVRERDLEKFFRKYGRIKEVAMKNGFAFVVSLKWYNCFYLQYGRDKGLCRWAHIWKAHGKKDGSQKNIILRVIEIM